jgi:hypothetical protein
MFPAFSFIENLVNQMFDNYSATNFYIGGICRSRKEKVSIWETICGPAPPQFSNTCAAAELVLVTQLVKINSNNIVPPPKLLPLDVSVNLASRSQLDPTKE